MRRKRHVKRWMWYAPLANRLGMNAIKTELEELSFKVLYPKIYNEIVVLVARRAGQRDVYLKPDSRRNQ